MVLTGQNIICISTMPWDFLWTRKQRFMLLLSKQDNKILYVEPTHSMLEKTREEKKKNSLLPRLKKINDNLSVLTPPLVFPFIRYGTIRRINYNYILLFIKYYQARMKMDNPILWLYPPWAECSVTKFNEKLVIYDCVDEHSAYPGTNTQLILEQELRLLHKADLVFVTAKGLIEERKKINPKIFFIPNGVDYSHFSKARDESVMIPDDIRNIKHPIIGFVGGISSWVDLQLIKNVAQKRKNWNFVLIGPHDRSEIDLHMFDELPNVFLLGKREKGMLPQYIKNFDVCINPFKINRLTNTVNPLKVYEYLASGKPIVSVDMPEVRFLEGIIKIARNPDEFVDFIDYAISDQAESNIEKRQQVAKQFSWEILLEQISQHIIKCLSE